MERLLHPHIIRVYEVHEVLQRWHLVMEYAPKGELNSHLKRSGRLDEKTAKNYSSQILSAIEHMMEPIRDGQGNLITKGEKQIKQQANHFKRILNRPPHATRQEIATTVSTEL
ncbi:unnamed protein product [Trichobilharzia regenti]|nr:unnamed protein product [Trichobilharzia regenti]